MKQLLAAFIVLFCLSLISPSAHATNPLASDIAGTVVDDTKTPVVGALVEIRHVETGRVIVRRTNSKGHYVALNVRPDGTYIVRVMDATGHRAPVTFAAMPVLLGERMRRNAVLLDHPASKPAFMRSWIWHQPPSDSKQALSNLGYFAVDIDQHLPSHCSYRKTKTSLYFRPSLAM